MTHTTPGEKRPFVVHSYRLSNVCQFSRHLVEMEHRSNCARDPRGVPLGRGDAGAPKPSRQVMTTLRRRH
jgi:hypothetical protein